MKEELRNLKKDIKYTIGKQGVMKKVKDKEEQFDEDSNEEQDESIYTDKGCGICHFKCLSEDNMKRHLNSKHSGLTTDIHEN